MIDLDSYILDKIYQHISGEKVRYDDRINMRCFCCGDSKKSRTKKRGWYYVKTRNFYCWNCGISLQMVKFLASIQNVQPMEVRREMYRLGLLSKENLLRRPGSLSGSYQADVRAAPKAEDFVIPETWTELSEEHRKYLEDRKIGEAPFLPTGSLDYFMTDSETNRIVIPWLDRTGRICYYQKRAFNGEDPKYLFPYEVMRPIFPLDIDPSHRRIYVLEGFLNAVWLRNSIVAGSVILSDHQRSMIDQYRTDGYEVIYAFDNHWVDDSAREIAEKYSRADKNALFLDWPRDVSQKDLNDMAIAGNLTRLDPKGNPPVISAAKLMVRLKFGR